MHTDVNIEFTEKKILKATQALKIAKSTGVDNLPPRTLNEILAEIAPLLSSLLDEKWTTAGLPNDWLRAIVESLF